MAGNPAAAVVVHHRLPVCGAGQRYRRRWAVLGPGADWQPISGGQKLPHRGTRRVTLPLQSVLAYCSGVQSCLPVGDIFEQHACSKPDKEVKQKCCLQTGLPRNGVALPWRCAPSLRRAHNLPLAAWQVCAFGPPCLRILRQCASVDKIRFKPLLLPCLFAISFQAAPCLHAHPCLWCTRLHAQASKQHLSARPPSRPPACLHVCLPAYRLPSCMLASQPAWLPARQVRAGIPLTRPFLVCCSHAVRRPSKCLLFCNFKTIAR